MVTGMFSFSAMFLIIISDVPAAYDVQDICDVLDAAQVVEVYNENSYQKSHSALCSTGQRQAAAIGQSLSVSPQTVITKITVSFQT